MENIGEKIMQARKTKGMTQDTLAQLVNVSRQTVSHWENGRAMPDVATAAQLSKVLDVNFLADEAAEDAAVQSPEAMPMMQESVQETQEQTDGRFETLMLGLRMTCGVSESEFQERHGVSLDALYGEKLRKFEHEGLLQHKTDRWSLTRRGMDVQNAILVELMDD